MSDGSGPRVSRFFASEGDRNASEPSAAVLGASGFTYQTSRAKRWLGRQLIQGIAARYRIAASEPVLEKGAFSANATHCGGGVVW